MITSIVSCYLYEVLPICQLIREKLRLRHDCLYSEFYSNTKTCPTNEFQDCWWRHLLPSDTTKALGVGNNITFLKETKTSRFSVITSCQIIFKEEIALKITMPGIAILRESNKWSRDPEFNPEKIIISLSYTWHYLRTRRPLVQRSVAETRSQDDVEK